MHCSVKSISAYISFIHPAINWRDLWNEEAEK